MVKRVFYDRRDVAATEVQFFHEGRMKRTRKEFDTNMELDGIWPTDFTIRKIKVHINPKLLSTAVARDGTLDDEIIRMLNDMIIQIQVGTGEMHYIPLISCLAALKTEGSVAYALATAADSSYALMSIANPADGLEYEIPVPARTPLKLFIKSATTPALGIVTVCLEGDLA